MFMWKSYEKFASTTELHGFDQVLKYNKFWSAAWLCLSILAVGFCTNDVVNLVILYLSQPVTTLIEVPQDVDFYLPNPTLCMEVHVDFPYAGYDPTSYIIPSMSDIDRDVSAFLQATADAENLDLSSYEQLHLSDNLQYFTYMMLSHITEAELTYVGYNNIEFYTWEAVIPFPYYWTSYYTPEIKMKFNATIGYLYHAYLKRNVNFANLKRLIAMSICQKRTGQLTMRNGQATVSNRICKPRMITHLSFALVCSKLLEDEVNDNLVNYDNFTLSGTKLVETVETNPPITEIPHITYDETSAGTFVSFAWHLDFQGRPTLPPGRQDIATWNPTTFSAMEISVANENQFYNRRVKPCTDWELVFDCDWRSRVEMLYGSCACRPSSFLFGIDNVSLPPCSDNPEIPAWTLFTNDSNIVTNSKFNGIGCDNKPVGNFSQISCMRNCWIVSFRIQKDAPTKLVKIGEAGMGSLPLGSVDFTLKLVSHEYLAIKETAAKDFFSFMWDCGGTVGAWLGGSLMAFVHAFFHMFMSCYQYGKHLGGKGIKK